MPLIRSLRCRALGAVLVVIAATVLAAVPTGASVAQTTPTAVATTAPTGPTTTLSPADARAKIRQERKQAGGEISSLRASDADVRKALDDLDARLAAANGALDTATAFLAKAQADVAAAEDAEAHAKDAADEALADVKQMAIDAYVNPPGDGLAIVLASGSIGEARERQSMLQIRVEDRNELLRRRRAAVAEVKRKHREAEKAVEASQAAADSQSQAVADLEATRGAHVQLVAEVDQRLNAALGEAAGLAALDQQLSDQISAQQQQLRAEAFARQAAAVQAATAAAAIAPPTTAPKKSSPTTTTPPRVTPPSLYSISDMDLVDGIYVNKLISSRFAQMMAASRSAGLTLGGGGFRDSAGQIATRRNNCGPTDYDIYVKPAGECSPPTARPGTSMHEQGMAIDITCSGALIRDHASTCFVWLAANAASYGFYNLPSEPWHWSVNGN
jgi:septal ring factor EnvC (AmiA/AmiB activator)